MPWREIGPTVLSFVLSSCTFGANKTSSAIWKGKESRLKECKKKKVGAYRAKVCERSLLHFFLFHSWVLARFTSTRMTLLLAVRW